MKGRFAIFSDSANKLEPSWAKFWAFDDTPWNRYFEFKEDAIHYARLNEVMVKDLATEEIIFDTYHKGEEYEN